MKLVNAVWEKRNLGVNCEEITIEVSDKEDEVKKMLMGSRNKDYIVVRLPVACSQFLSGLQENGFRFMETAITMETELEEIVLPSRYARLVSGVTYEPFTDENLSELYLEIEKEIFTTDRVALDGRFGRAAAAKRYIGWIGDMKDRGIYPCRVRYREEEVGFFLQSSVENGVCHGLLAGVYEDYIGTGMGLLVQYAGLMSAKKHGARRYYGNVSSNNPAVLKNLDSMGQHIVDMEYVFVKHID